MRAALAEAVRALRQRRHRTALATIGIALAAAMLAAAIVVVAGLGSGFDRAARAADLPDLTARFDRRPASEVARRVAALPDVAGFSLRDEVTGVGLGAGSHTSSGGVAEVVASGRRGYAIVAGRDVSGRPGEVVVERGFADAWGVRIGGALSVEGLAPQRVVGLAEAPDNVAYPLAAPRIYLARAGIDAVSGAPREPRVNVVQIWLRRHADVDQVLVQARATSYGLRGLRFVTRAGVRVLLDQAAGIVIDLLVALSAIAVATASVMLAASARADTERRLGAIGVRRAVGASRGHVAAAHALEALLVAAPAATAGTAAGALATYGPSSRLLTMLNEPPPGAALLVPLALGWLASVAIPALAAGWPAWQAAGRAPVALLEGGELGTGARRGLGRVRGAALGALGVRLAGARRIRLAATALTLGVSAAFVLLMLALASALQSLETDPGALGKRYELSASLPAERSSDVRAVPGVRAAAPRYEEQAADSFSLGETIDVVAYPGDHTLFEAPPLMAGRRLRGGEAEVGAGLASALGLSPGSTLALALPSGAELRLRVAGVVSSLAHDGRVAYVPARALLAADPAAPEQIAVRLQAGADAGAVSARLSALGAPAAPAGGATARGQPLVAVLRALLRAVAIVDGLVCIYALIQACALTVQERRRTVAVIRACGAGPRAVRRLLAGAAAAVVVPAAIVAVPVERFLLGPLLGHLAAGYATLPLPAGAVAVGAVVAGLVAAAAVSVAWVGRLVAREAIVAGLGAR